MQQVLPPLCLLLALALVICGFAVLSVDAPEANVELHRARAEVNELVLDDLESDLLHQQRRRILLLVLLFGGGVGMAVLGFAIMRPSRS